MGTIATTVGVKPVRGSSLKATLLHRNIKYSYLLFRAFKDKDNEKMYIMFNKLFANVEKTARALEDD